MKQLRYRPEIDGLRAVAVLAVVFFHANRAVPGGFTGVDVFFVISGFLITGLIQKDIDAEQFRLADFWERRVRRILPALAGMVAVVLAVGIACLLPRDLGDLGRSAAAQSMLCSNFYFWSTIDYFGGPAELKPLLHTWSLAVEEQFYILFPLLLSACGKMQRPKLFAAVAWLALGSFAWSLWGTLACPSASFFLLPARAWELLLGALVALAPPQRIAPRWLNEIGSVAGLAGIGMACLLYDDSTRFPGLAALLPCASTAAVIYCNGPGETLVGRVLALKPLVGVGLISYSLYLWHWPVFAYARYLFDENLTGWHCPIAITAACIIACLSWRFVELPFRCRREAQRRVRVFATALSVSAILLVVSTVCWQTKGLPRRFPSDVLQLVTAEDVPGRFKQVDLDQIASGRLPVVGSVRDEGDRPSFLLWGDSHAMAVSELLDDLARKHGMFGYMATHPGTVPLLGTWRQGRHEQSVAWNRAVVEFVERRRIPNVILISRWSVNVEGGPGGSLETLIVDEQSQGVTPAESKLALKRGLERTIAALSRAGATVWIMKQVPEQREDPRRALVRAVLARGFINPQGVSLVEHRRRQANVDDVLAAVQADNVHLLDPAGFCFNSSGTSLIAGAGCAFYADDNHLTATGATQLLSRMFETCLTQIVENEGPVAHRELRVLR
jgi:peptidoglycan/LPS O-acetylase OafA/YrhL